MKRCFKCGTEKPRGEFYAHPQMADGLLGKCKECAKTDVRSNRAANADYYKAYEKQRANLPRRIAGRKKYAASESGREAARQARSRWEMENQHKRAAHFAVGNAVRDGRLKKPPYCTVCGRFGRVYGHHHDYDKPLDVQWVCAKCHAAEHKREAA